MREAPSPDLISAVDFSGKPVPTLHFPHTLPPNEVALHTWLLLCLS